MEPAETPLPTLKEIERDAILERLKLHDGDRHLAAKSLGIRAEVIYDKLHRSRPPELPEGFRAPNVARMKLPPDQELFTTGEVARLLGGMSPRTAAHLIDSGQLKGYRIPLSEHRRVTRAALVAFMQKLGFSFD